MLSGSWFSSRTASGRPVPPKGQTSAGPSGKSSLDRERTPAVPDPTTDEPNKKRALTAALSTPHDAVLAELQGHRPDYDPTPQIDAATNAGLGVGGVSGINTLSALGEDGETVLSSTTASPNLGATPKVARQTQQTLYDPFTGAPLGIIQPQMPGSSSTPGVHFGSGTDGVGQELWTQLDRIRGLQADIATMHVTMESIGGFGENAAKRGARVRRRSTGGEKLDEGGGMGDDWGGEEWQKKDRDAEFEQSESRFAGRKEEIDAIMGKLGELSQALATFHALETPSVDFNNATRSNTQSSGPVPPSPSSPNIFRPRHPSIMRLSTDDSDPPLDSPMSMVSPLPMEHYGYNPGSSHD